MRLGLISTQAIYINGYAHQRGRGSFLPGLKFSICSNRWWSVGVGKVITLVLLDLWITRNGPGLAISRHFWRFQMQSATRNNITGTRSEWIVMIMTADARRRITAITGLDPFYPDSEIWYAQMGSSPLPADIDINLLKKQLYDKYHIEIPIINWNGQNLIRYSFQAYNTQQDIDALEIALKYLLTGF